MAFDNLLASLGGFGSYQRRIFAVVCLLEMVIPLHILCQVFYTLPVDHWCRDSTLESCPHHWNMTLLECQETIKNLTIPFDEKTSTYSQCSKYITQESENRSKWTTVGCDEGWHYDPHSPSSIQTDFDLVCERSSLTQVAQSIFFAGIMVSSLFCVLYGDRFGRLRVLFVGIGGTSLMGLILAVTPNYATYVVVRFIVAAFLWMTMSSCYIHLTENISSSYRVFVTCGVGVPFGIGFSILAGLAYLVPNWRTIQIVISLPMLAFFIFWPIFMESPRWLLSRGRWTDAEKILKKIVRLNKKKTELSKESLDNLEESLRNETQTISLRQLFRLPRLRLRTMTLMFNWFVQSFVYYGLSLSTSSFGVNVYVAFCIAGAVEVPAAMLSFALVKYAGRRHALILTMVPAGIACISTGFLPLGPIMTTAAMIGKFAISSSFATVYLYTVELFSTNLRSAGLGIGSLGSRIGGICAPLVLLLDGLWQPLPQIVFGATSVIAGLLVVLLPETKGQPMPQTTEEAESLGRTIIRLPNEPPEDEEP